MFVIKYVSTNYPLFVTRVTTGGLYQLNVVAAKRQQLPVFSGSKDIRLPLFTCGTDHALHAQ